MKSKVTEDLKVLKFFDYSAIWNIILILFLVLNFVIAIIAAYYTAHYIIRPLRILNVKMKMIIHSNGS